MTNLAAIEKLSDPEKILLVEKIWDSINKANIELTSTQKSELDKRLKADKAGEMKYENWEVVKKRIRRKR